MHGSLIKGPSIYYQLADMRLCYFLPIDRQHQQTGPHSLTATDRMPSLTGKGDAEQTKRLINILRTTPSLMQVLVGSRDSRAKTGLAGGCGRSVQTAAAIAPVARLRAQGDRRSATFLNLTLASKSRDNLSLYTRYCRGATSRHRTLMAILRNLACCLRLRGVTSVAL